MFTLPAKIVRVTLTALALALVCISPAAAAVEIAIGASPDPELQLVTISGKIERGDAQRVQQFLATLPKGRPVAVALHSPGGLIDEALRMGRHFHANRIRTYVTGWGRECASACALAFLGGRDADGGTFRVKGTGAKLGYHGFRRIVAEKEFTVADMHEAVATTQRVLLTIADYLTSVDADIEFMSMMLEAPNGAMNYLDDAKALSIGVHVLDEASALLSAPASVGNR